MSRASWLRSESVSVIEDDDELMLSPATMCGGAEGSPKGTGFSDMGGR